MTAIRIEITDQAVLAALERMRRSTANPGPALRAIGESLAESTKRRFETATGPDGEPWAANSEITVLRYLGKKGGLKKDGTLSKKGVAAKGSKKPLTGETRKLSQQIHYQVSGAGRLAAGGTLEIGSTMEYAAMQQFGGRKSQFPWLWGDIPARPFLGISAGDRVMIEATILEYLGGAV